MPTKSIAKEQGFNLMEYIKNCGYEDTSPRGMCFGFAHMSMYAMLLGSWNTSFMERLGLINRLFHKNPIPTSLQPKRINKIDIGAFLDGIQLYQVSQNSIIYDKLLDTKSSITKNYFEYNHNLLQPVLFQDAELDLDTVFNSFGCYKTTELNLLLQAIKEAILDAVVRDGVINTKFNHIIPICFSSNRHAIMLGYNYRNNTWVIANINLLDNLEIIKSSYQKEDIVALLYKAFTSSAIVYHEQVIIDLTIKIYVANQRSQKDQQYYCKKTYFQEKLNNNHTWQQINKITPDKLAITITYNSWLLAATQIGDLSLVKQLLVANADVNLALTNNTPVITIGNIMIRNQENFRIYKVSNKLTSIFNYPNTLGTTPIFKAAENGNPEVIKLLIENKANVDATNVEKISPTLIAAYYGNIQVVALLIQAKANINAADIHGITPLWKVAQCGYAPIAELLIKNNANVEAANLEGITPLFTAAEHGHAEVVKLLLENKANVDATNVEKISTILIAAYYGNTQVVALLIQAKANIDAPDLKGITPLWKASQNGHTPVVELLLQAKANIDAPDREGLTSLWKASQNGHTSVVELLIQAKANIDAHDREGLTSLWKVAQYGYAPIAELLIKNNANVDAPDLKGITPLWKASQNGHAPVVELLIQAKANIDAPNNSQITPAGIAANKGHINIAAKLMKAKLIKDNLYTLSAIAEMLSKAKQQNNATLIKILTCLEPPPFRKVNTAKLNPIVL